MLNKHSIRHLLNVSEKTAIRYRKGNIPPIPQQLIDLHTNGQVMPSTWDGWSFHKNALWSPDGEDFSPGDLNRYRFLARNLYLPK